MLTPHNHFFGWQKVLHPPSSQSRCLFTQPRQCTFSKAAWTVQQAVVLLPWPPTKALFLFQLPLWSCHEVKYQRDLFMPPILSRECWGTVSHRVGKNKDGIKREKEIILFTDTCKMTLNFVLGVKVLWWADMNSSSNSLCKPGLTI